VGYGYVALACGDGAASAQSRLAGPAAQGREALHAAATRNRLYSKRRAAAGGPLRGPCSSVMQDREPIYSDCSAGEACRFGSKNWISTGADTGPDEN
jgi:hypothetical protein